VVMAEPAQQHVIAAWRVRTGTVHPGHDDIGGIRLERTSKLHSIENIERAAETKTFGGDAGVMQCLQPVRMSAQKGFLFDLAGGVQALHQTHIKTLGAAAFGAGQNLGDAHYFVAPDLRDGCASSCSSKPW